MTSMRTQLAQMILEQVENKMEIKREEQVKEF